MIKKLMKHYKNMSIQVKSAIWYMFCSVLPQAISVVTTVVFTRVLSTSEFGISSNYTSWYNVISVFITLSLSAGAYNNAMLKYENKRDEYDASMMGLSLVLGVVGCVIFIPFASFWSETMALPIILIVFLSLHCLMYNPYNCMLARAKYEYNYKKLIYITLLTSLSSLLCSIAFVLLISANAICKIIGQYIMILLLGIYVYIKTFIKGGKLYNKDYWKYALTFNLPLVPHYLSLIILNQSDRIMIIKMCGASENGIYSLAYSAGSLILIFNSGITQAFTPWVYEKCRARECNDIKKTIKLLFTLHGCIVILFVMLAPELVAVLAGKEYTDAISIISPIAISMYFIFVYNIMSMLEFYHEKTKPVMVCSMISAMINLGLNYVVIQVYGYKSAAYTTLACYLFNAIFHYFIIKKLYKKYYSNESDFFAIRYSGFIGLILLGVLLLSQLLYENVLVRFVVIAMLMFFIYSKRKFIISFIRRK